VSNFIEKEIEKFIEENPGERIVTRFPPEPNGYLHIGHAKSIVLNFELANKYGGICNLRFDDTNPDTEDTNFVKAILRDISWLGYNPDNVNYASEYFPLFYSVAVDMTLAGMAYVCTHSEDEISSNRGTVKSHGTPCDCRSREVEDNIALLNKMHRGYLDEGGAVLRAKINLASPNMKMRDPIMYRIKHSEHHRTGNLWKIYPIYDFAHCLSDSIEKVTHSICTLEFDNNRELYDWYVDAAKSVGYFRDSKNRQYEMAKLTLEGTVLSKRVLKSVVNDADKVAGWSDPVMPTLSGLRTRGVHPQIIKKFIMGVGVSKSDDSVVSVDYFSSVIREFYEDKVQRVYAAFNPILLEIEGLDEDVIVHADNWSKNSELSGTRELTLSSTVWIDSADYTDNPNSKWKRLAPGRVVRLKSGCIVECIGRKEGSSNVILSKLVEGSIGGAAPEGVKPKGTITWVPFESMKIVIRNMNNLFNDDGSYNDDHTKFVAARIEGDFNKYSGFECVYQIERNGYYSIYGHRGTRVASLKSNWNKS
jgi:glutaminyl-tRNA synthetase